MNTENLVAFERAVRIFFDAEAGNDQTRYRWGEVLRAIYGQQQNADAYVVVCQQTALSANDCLVLAGMYQERKPDEALAWVERGLLLDKKKPHESSASDDLAKLKRELLARLVRADVALAEAWAEFQQAPSMYRYEELMRFVGNKPFKWKGRYELLRSKPLQPNFFSPNELRGPCGHPNFLGEWQSEFAATQFFG
jgi:hypothetical protein